MAVTRNCLHAAEKFAMRGLGCGIHVTIRVGVCAMGSLSLTKRYADARFHFSKNRVTSRTTLTTKVSALRPEGVRVLFLTFGGTMCFAARVYFLCLRPIKSTPFQKGITLAGLTLEISSAPPLLPTMNVARSGAPAQWSSLGTSLIGDRLL